MENSKMEIVKKLEKLEQDILKEAQIAPQLEMGGILIRTAHKIRLTLEFYEESLRNLYNENKNGE